MPSSSRWQLQSSSTHKHTVDSRIEEARELLDFDVDAFVDRYFRREEDDERGAL